MIRIFPKSTAPQHVSVLIDIHVGVKEFKNQSEAINFLEKVKFQEPEILACDFVMALE